MMMMVVIMLIFLIYMLFLYISYKIMYNMESSSSYECGFNYMSKSRISFSYRFFLIGILFLIFDVEIVLLLSIPYLEYNILMIQVFIMFMIILMLGLMYEYYYGSLEWIELFISKA